MGTNNNLRTLLEQAAASGRTPDDAAIDALITRRAGVTSIRDARRGIAQAARTVVEHAEAGHPRMLAGAIDAAVQRYGSVTGAAVETPAQSSAGVDRTGGATFVNGKRVCAQDVTHREPLRQLLRYAAGGADLDERDLDVELDPDLSEKQRAAFRRELAGATREITGLAQSGHLGRARGLADRVTATLGDNLKRATVDQHETDGLGPDELAALIPRR
jgi:hypothetical protein